MPNTDDNVQRIVSKMKEKGLIPEKGNNKKEEILPSQQSNAGDGNIFQGNAGRDMNVKVGNVTVNPRTVAEGPDIIPYTKCKNFIAINALACPNCGTPVAEILRKARAKEDYDKALKVSATLGIILGILSVLLLSDLPFIKRYLTYCATAILLLLLFGVYRIFALREIFTKE